MVVAQILVGNMKGEREEVLLPEVARKNKGVSPPSAPWKGLLLLTP